MVRRGVWMVWMAWGWMGCAASSPAPASPPAPLAAEVASCEVCGGDACSCGPPPPVAPPQRCWDGSEEQINITCEVTQGSCGWRVARGGCPPACTQAQCGAMPEGLSERCPHNVSFKRYAVCGYNADGACGWTLVDNDCAAPPPSCDANTPCAEADQYCEVAMGACEGAGVCTLKPLTCEGKRGEVCGCFGEGYPSACHAAMAGVPVEHKGACLKPKPKPEEPRRKRPLCKDTAACGQQPPIAPPPMCDDGQRGSAEVRCERDQGRCVWHAEYVCPPPLPDKR
jgi:hypothetical protein